MVCNAFPSYKPQDISTTIDVWYAMLSDIPYKLGEQAVYVYIRTDTSGFAPAIGKIVEIINSFGKEDDDAAIVWTMVSKAIRRSAYGSKEEYEKLPEIAQKVLGGPHRLFEMSQDEKFNEGVESSNFMKSYRVIQERQKRMDMLPQEMRMQLEQSRQQLLIENRG